MRGLTEAGPKPRTKLWGTMRSAPRKSHQKSGFRSEQRRLSGEQSVMQRCPRKTTTIKSLVTFT